MSALERFLLCLIYQAATHRTAYLYDQGREDEITEQQVRDRIALLMHISPMFVSGVVVIYPGSLAYVDGLE